MKTFFLTDPHGNFKGIKQCIERSGINKDEDLLITGGDVADGYDEVYDCIEEFLTFKNRIDIRGNHDFWFLAWLNTFSHPDGWRQGGMATMRSYLKAIGKEELIDGIGLFSGPLLYPKDVPLSHWKFFAGQKLYHKDEKGRVFVHGGWNRHYTLSEIKNMSPEEFWWDRELIQAAMSVKGDQKLKFKEPGITEVFLGHTGTLYWEKSTPIHTDIIWNCDTGGGERKGRVTIMDIDSKEYWQSDLGEELYPDQRGRH